jgi:hypothetical protein
MEQRPIAADRPVNQHSDDPDRVVPGTAEHAESEVSGRYGDPWEKDALPGGSGETPMQPEPEPEIEDETGSGGIVSQLQSLAEPVANIAAPIVDHLVIPMAGRIGTVIGAASQAIGATDSLAGRRVKRMAREPLDNLYDLYPEVRDASPRELGMRFVPVEDIRGTAVAGIAQRGGDFLPLKPFRGENWESRWKRIRNAVDRLQPLPPVDLIKYAGEYWVVDGHNRVAAALYTNGAGLDAMVTELVPLDGHVSEQPTPLLSILPEAGHMRAAAAGLRPAAGLRQWELSTGDDPGDLLDPVTVLESSSEAWD